MLGRADARCAWLILQPLSDERVHACFRQSYEPYLAIVEALASCKLQRLHQALMLFSLPMAHNRPRFLPKDM
jgi:hypothetical protein